ncbi:MAG: L,D-transpeptidase family protein [Rhodospirillales bacterium]|nr:L,D-transpeptidase family protein [Rhodospirillales bacterium]
MRFFLPALLIIAAFPVWAADVYDRPYIGDMKTHTTVFEDTFIQIARDNNIGFNELRSANPDIDPWLPGADVKLTLPTRHILPDADHQGIVINLPEMRLYYFKDKNEPPITHPLGVGREGLATPTGTTSIVRKVDGPIWRPTPRMREENPDLPAAVPPGTENPMGTHALYLGWPQYALHGTNKPYGIGRRVSSGCIRLYPEDIKTMYRDVPVGTKVTVIDQPVKLAWIDDTLYLEAHPRLDQAIKIEQEGGLPDYQLGADEMKAIIKAAGKDEALLDWPLVRKLVRERNGYPVAIAHRPVDKKQTVSEIEEETHEEEKEPSPTEESEESEDHDAPAKAPSPDVQEDENEGGESASSSAKESSDDEDMKAAADDETEDAPASQPRWRSLNP